MGFLKKTTVLILNSNQNVDKYIMRANNYKLYAVYKIGMYGISSQHELFVTGFIWDIYKFKNQMDEMDLEY